MTLDTQIASDVIRSDRIFRSSNVDRCAPRLAGAAYRVYSVLVLSPKQPRTGAAAEEGRRLQNTTSCSVPCTERRVG
jgi:hypothetical protein